MIFQADLEFPFTDVGFCKIQFAGAQGNSRPHKIDQLPNLGNGCEWPKIFGTVIDLSSCKKHPWKRFIFYYYKWIGFVILEIDIKPGLKLFDECILQEEGILL